MNAVARASAVVLLFLSLVQAEVRQVVPDSPIPAMPVLDFVPVETQLDLNNDGVADLKVRRGQNLSEFMLLARLRFLHTSAIHPLAPEFSLGPDTELPPYVGWSGRGPSAVATLISPLSSPNSIPFRGGIKGYAGFDWVMADGIHFGWMRIDTKAPGARITGWAWESVPNRPIIIPNDLGHTTIVTTMGRLENVFYLSWIGLDNEAFEVQYSEKMKPGTWIVIHSTTIHAQYPSHQVPYVPTPTLFLDQDLARVSKSSGYYRIVKLDDPP